MISINASIDRVRIAPRWRNLDGASLDWCDDASTAARDAVRRGRRRAGDEDVARGEFDGGF